MSTNIEDVNILVCGSGDIERMDKVFSDNVHGHCAACGCEIVWRPYAPEPTLKLCFPCAASDVSDMVERGDVPEVAITKETFDEVKKMGLL